MELRFLTGVAAAALTMTACADADSDTAPDDILAGEEMTEAAETIDPESEMPGATDPLAGDPDAEGDDGTLGSDRVMQGEWTARQMAGAPAALFGEPNTDARFSVRCKNGELIFTRGARQPEGDVEMALMAGGETKRITATSTPDPLPTVTGRLSADDAFAATLADVSEPIAVRIGGGASLRMPASGAFRDVVSGCRS